VAREVVDEQRRLMSPALSWRLELRDGRLTWCDEMDGMSRTLRSEPGSSWGRWAVATLARVLPVEEQL
jgi:hypothetical protein